MSIHHLLDLSEFLEELWMDCSVYSDKSGEQTFINESDLSWASEQLLFLIQKWSTGVTKEVLLQDLVTKVKSMRSQGKVKPQSVRAPVLHAIIDSIGLTPEKVPVVMNIHQVDCNTPLTSAFHGAFVLVYNEYPHIFSIGRKIHIANPIFPAEQLLSTQLCVIDLLNTPSDLEFIERIAQGNCLSQINNTQVKGLVVKVIRDTPSGILVHDGSSSKPIEFHLEESQKQLKLLLRFDDILLLYEPLSTCDNLSPYLFLGPNTVFFRIPYIDQTNSQTSQTSQYLTQDGLLIRNSPACRSVSGTVESLRIIGDSGISVQMLIGIRDKSGELKNILASFDLCDFYTKKLLQQLRIGHFVYIFGLKVTGYSQISSSDSQMSFPLTNSFDLNSNSQGNYLKFNKETTIFDTSLMSGIESSGFVNPCPLSSCEFFTTYVSRATIVDVKYDIQKVHRECGGCLVRGRCPLCSGMPIPLDMYEEMIVLTLSIDDGSCPHVQVMGLQTLFPHWGVTVKDMKSALEEEKERFLQRLLGKEFLFVISRGSSKEFGELQESPIWRIDQCLKPVGDTERTVQRLIQFHQKLDQADGI